MLLTSPIVVSNSITASPLEDSTGIIPANFSLSCGTGSNIESNIRGTRCEFGSGTLITVGGDEPPNSLIRAMFSFRMIGDTPSRSKKQHFQQQSHARWK